MIHKAKKFNYVCDINPTKISSISGQITDLKGDPVFHGKTATTLKKYTYALVGIDSWDTLVSPTKQRALIKNELVTSITPGIKDPVMNVRILSNTLVDTSIIYFTSTTEITDQWDNISISFIVPKNDSTYPYSFTLTYAANPGMILLKGNGRFISEFSIVSRV